MRRMLSAEHLSKTYGEQKALDDVHFSVSRGEIVGLLGPNGAGKSTLMKILTGYLSPTSGAAYVNGLDMSRQSLDARRIIGYLPEHNPLYTDMYVREYLQFMGRLHRIPRAPLRQRIDEMIATVGITAEQHKKIGQLSKGYRQRVGLAQALLHNPPILILDEPTSGLDPVQIMDVRTLISGLGKEKIILFSTHIMQEVTAVCNRVIIVNQGKIAIDTPLSQKKDVETLENFFRTLTKK